MLEELMRWTWLPPQAYLTCSLEVRGRRHYQNLLDFLAKIGGKASEIADNQVRGACDRCQKSGAFIPAEDAERRPGVRQHPTAAA
jgi:cytidylate kinase